MAQPQQQASPWQIATTKCSLTPNTCKPPTRSAVAATTACREPGGSLAEQKLALGLMDPCKRSVESAICPAQLSTLGSPPCSQKLQKGRQRPIPGLTQSRGVGCYKRGGYLQNTCKSATPTGGGAKGIPSTMTVFEMFLLAPLCCSIAGPSFCRHLRVGMDWIKLFKATKPKACANTTQRKS